MTESECEELLKEIETDPVEVEFVDRGKLIDGRGRPIVVDDESS